MNSLSFSGYTDPRFGYGSMYWGFRDSLPKTVQVVDSASVTVHMSVPSTVKGWWDGQFRSLFTMWETDELPSDFRKWVGQYDRVLVPCQHNVELFGRYHDDVVAVPLGVDHSVWLPSHDPSGPFKFVAGGSLWMRKGLDIVVEAFHRAGLGDAELHIKAAPHALDVPKRRLGDRVFLHRLWMSVEDTVAFYRSAHCVVAPARGEGWGLMPLQAIAAGIPTILSDTSGQSEFKDVATLVVPTAKKKSNTIGYWDEASVDDVAEAMREIHRDWVFYRDVALGMATKSKKYSWQKASQKLVRALPTGVEIEPSTWVNPDVSYRVRAVRPVKADIGLVRWIMTPGEEYTVPHGVFQVLYDSGALEEV